VTQVPVAAPGPRLVVTPAVVFAGRVTRAVGSNYPPHALVHLSSPTGFGYPDTVRADALGGFTVPLVLAHRDGLGPRTLVGTAGAASAGAPYVVMAPAAEPSSSQQLIRR
jgi:predicted alpha/beta-hydrolase family hydrolase